MDALIGNLLGQFIVQDFEDAKLLQRILKQNHWFFFFFFFFFLQFLVYE